MVLPFIASGLGIRSCLERERPSAEYRLDTVFDRSISAADAGGNDVQHDVRHDVRHDLRSVLVRLRSDMLLPTVPFPRVRQPNARVMVTKAKPDGTVVGTYQVGGNRTTFLLTVSPTGQICTPQSVIHWEQPVPIRTATGCLARNPGAAGGVFIEWLERGHSVHVEATSADADAVLAWLGSWRWLRS